jgi:hypothetical protein
MARSGLTVEYFLAPDPGITGAGDTTGTGVVRGIGVAATGAKAGATAGEESTHVAAMVAAITEVMRTAATPEATASVAKVASTEGAEVASTAEADPTVADTGNSTLEAQRPKRGDGWQQSAASRFAYS